MLIQLQGESVSSAWVQVVSFCVLVLAAGLDESIPSLQLTAFEKRAVSPQRNGTHISCLPGIVPEDLLPPRHVTKQILPVDSLAHPPA